jgi:glyoxylase-like metal-dependent hydrolase (beta-lactamase superfamily II)
MSTGASVKTALKWDVFVAKRQGLTRDLPPGKEEWMWVPGSATLIYGEKDALLVDTLLTIEQAKALLEWVAAHDKNLTTIYVTHGHGDHFFGLGAVLDRFPNAKAVAMPEVVKVMRRQASPESVTSFWKARYPGQIPERLVIAEELRGGVIELEGRDLIPVLLGHTDTDNTTCLHVPSAGLVVAGDAAYNDVHLYLAESNAQTRREWIASGYRRPQESREGRQSQNHRRDAAVHPGFRALSRGDDYGAGALREDAGALSESSQSGLVVGLGALGERLEAQRRRRTWGSWKGRLRS